MRLSARTIPAACSCLPSPSPLASPLPLWPPPRCSPFPPSRADRQAGPRQGGWPRGAPRNAGPLIAGRWLAIGAATMAVLAGCKAEAPPAPAAPDPVVVVRPVQTGPLTLQRALPGRTVAYMVSDVRPQVGGIIRQRLFTEGQEVAAGDVLYQLDDRLYRAAVNSAAGDLAQAEAAVVGAAPKARRYRELAEIDAGSRQDADDAEATLRADRAAVTAARASLETAKINLDYTRVTAPIAGRIGTSTYTPGALVTANQDTALATVQQLDPIYVDVTQSSAQLLALRRQIDSGALKAVDGRTEVRLLLEDGSTYPQAGTLEVVGSSVSTGTGNITLRAVVPNPDRLLLPGAYVQAVLPVALNENAIRVPQSAVTRNNRGDAVVKLVGTDGKIEQRVVATGEALGDDWVVTDGLKAGDRLVVEGGSKTAPGQTVQVRAEAASTTATKE